MPTVPTPHDHAYSVETLAEKETRLTAETDLAGLGPLRDLIARTMAATPVRLGPDGADALIDDLTLAVAVYTAREVLPPGLLDAAAEVSSVWDVEFKFRGRWAVDTPTYDSRAEAEQRMAEQQSYRQEERRVVRVTTIRTVEAATPERCGVAFEGGGRCSKPAGHRPPGSQDPHTP